MSRPSLTSTLASSFLLHLRFDWFDSFFTWHVISDKRHDTSIRSIVGKPQRFYLCFERSLWVHPHSNHLRLLESRTILSCPQRKNTPPTLPTWCRRHNRRVAFDETYPWCAYPTTVAIDLSSWTYNRKLPYHHLRLPWSYGLILTKRRFHRPRYRMNSWIST